MVSRRVWLGAITVSVVLALSGCGGRDASGPPPTFIEQVTASPSGPAPSPIADGCKLLTLDEVSKAFGWTSVRVGLLPDTMGSGIAQCEYRSGTGYIDLFVADQAAKLSPQQAVDRVMNNSLGDRTPIQDVGDAAVYVNDTVDKQQSLVAVKTIGSSQRVVTLLAYLPSPSRPQLTGLLSNVVDRV